MKPDTAETEKIIRECIARFDLNLAGLSVLTEAAGGNYVVTPLIAGLAGASEVVAVTRDSEYGAASDVIADTLSRAEALGLNNIRIVTEKTPEIWAAADIVTNLGFVRPIDGGAAGLLKPTAVVPLMWEPWEFHLRTGDVDLAACRERGVLVIGTDEGHRLLKFRKYVGLLCAKLLEEAGVAPKRHRILVVSSGQFALAIGEVLLEMGAEVAFVAPDETDCGGARIIAGEMAEDAAREWLGSADALLVAEHTCGDPLVPDGADDLAQAAAHKNPSLKIVHLCGVFDRAPFLKAGIAISPAREPKPGYMALSTDYLGPRPVIELHSAGLKVGEAAARARLEGMSVKAAEAAAMRLAPAALMED